MEDGVALEDDGVAVAGEAAEGDAGLNEVDVVVLGERVEAVAEEDGARAVEVVEGEDGVDEFRGGRDGDRVAGLCSERHGEEREECGDGEKTRSHAEDGRR